jgi:hypothetical protein
MKRCFITLIMAGIVSALSCSNSVTQTGNPTKIVLMVKTTAPTPGLQKAVFTSMPTQSISAVTLKSVEFVIGGVELNPLDSIDDNVSFDDNAPYIVDLNIGGNPTRLDSIVVQNGGVYQGVSLAIDSLTEDDTALYNGFPELQDRSFLIKGYLNNDTSEVFVFYSAISGTLDCPFNTPLDLSNGVSKNIIILLDVQAWFTDSSGHYIDPREPLSRAVIEENILTSVDVTEENN